MNLTRHVYRINKAGNINRLKLTQEPIGQPAQNEVQVEVRAIGLNFADIFALIGLYSATPKGSFVPGLEFSGIIKAKGNQVSNWQIGQSVMGVTRFGGYASVINIEADYITAMPSGWNFEQGAAYLVQGLTAYYGLFQLGNIKKGDTVLIHSAAGGVGLLANRMAKKIGAYTIGTIGSSAKIDLLNEEGFDDYIVRDKQFKKMLKIALKDRELNIVMECIGGSVFSAGFEMLAPQGRLINYGSARYGDNSNMPNWPKLVWKYLTRPKIDPQSMIESNKAILGFNLIWLYHKKELMRQMIDEMEGLNLSPPHIGHVYKFSDLIKAVKIFQSGLTTGKVVVNLDE